MHALIVGTRAVYFVEIYQVRVTRLTFKSDVVGAFFKELLGRLDFIDATQERSLGLLFGH